MDELLDSDTGYVRPIVQFCSIADSSLILEISIHIQNFGKEDSEYGTHSRILETSTSVDVVETLEAEFKSQRGKFMISRKSRLKFLADYADALITV